MRKNERERERERERKRSTENDGEKQPGAQITAGSITTIKGLLISGAEPKTGFQARQEERYRSRREREREIERIDADRFAHL